MRNLPFGAVMIDLRIMDKLRLCVSGTPAEVWTVRRFRRERLAVASMEVGSSCRSSGRASHLVAMSMSGMPALPIAPDRRTMVSIGYKERKRDRTSRLRLRRVHMMSALTQHLRYIL